MLEKVLVIGILAVVALDAIRHFIPNTPPPNATTFQPIGMSPYSGVTRRAG